MLFYGSGASVSRRESPADIVYDFYVIGPTDEALFSSTALRIAGKLIPPNVFYIETPSPFGTLRAKYAALTIAQFEKLVSARTFHSYFWARFAQPCRIEAPDAAMRARLETALATACASFARACAGLCGDKFTARELWLAGLGVSYKAELRAEDETRAEKLIASYGGWIEETTAPALALAGFHVTLEDNGVIAIGRAPERADFAWRLRAVQGAGLSVLRLLKGTQTFQGGIDYIAWKIKRHSGIDLQITDWERRHPMLGAPGAALRYYRLRAVKAKTAS
ncbi:MAG: hypothetical protein R3C58_00665 [Parvularculaceae bacterium]